MDERKPGFIDGFTRIDDLLAENTAALNKLMDILQLKEDVVGKPLFLTYPSSGSALVTLEEGTTVLNFESGTITDVGGEVTEMKQSLQKRGFEWARSFFVQSDRLISVQIDSNDPIIAGEERDAYGIHQQFKKITLTTYEDTDVFVIVSTSPDALIQLISNAMTLVDKKDAYGYRNYVGGGELASLLGGFKRFDRRGDVFLTENFERDITNRLYTYSNGNDDYVRRSLNYANYGNYTLEMYPGDANGKLARLNLYSSLVKTNRFGMEVGFVIDSAVGDIQLLLDIHTGTREYRSRIKWNKTADDLFIEDGTPNNDIEIASNVDFATTQYQMRNIKFVIDIDKEKYVRLLLADKEIDLSAYSLYNYGVSTHMFLSPQIIADNVSGNRPKVNLDYIIITGMEP